MTEMPALPPLCVYIHWPFCTTICPYCDFNVHVARTIDPVAWRVAYEKDMVHAKQLRPQGPVQSIFFGGGTPSLMPPALIAALIETIDRQWGLAPHAEISMEANPNHLSQHKLQDFHRAGITRLSLGIQSLNDKTLKFLGRTHSVAQAINMFTQAQEIFASTSLDLIYACPDQSQHDWQQDLKTALGLQPDHISAYQLSVEPHTPFFRRHQRGQLTLPSEDRQAAFYQITHALCQQAGLMQYEISNYARPNHACRHNRAIWNGADYIGIGPGAHGRVSAHGRISSANKTGGQNIRYATLGIRKPADWLAAVATKGHGLDICEALDKESLRDEILLTGLRLHDGIAMARLTAQDMQIDKAQWRMLVAKGFLRNDPTRLAATEKGRLVLDSVIAALVCGPSAPQSAAGRSISKV